MENRNSLARLVAKPTQNVMDAARSVADVAFPAVERPAERPYFNLRSVERTSGDKVVTCKATIGGRDAAATQVRIPHALRDKLDKYTSGPATVVLVALADAMLDQLLAGDKALHVGNADR